MNIIGIDPAARKLAVWNGVDFAFHKLSTEDPEACGQAFRLVSEFLTEHGAFENAVMYVEKPIQGRNTQGSLAQAVVQGSIFAAAAEFGVEVRRVDNMTWKRRVVGNAKAEKHEIATYVHRRDPEAFLKCDGNQDLMDALCIYWYGCWNHPLIEKTRKLHAQAEGKKQARKSATKQQRGHQDRAGAAA